MAVLIKQQRPTLLSRWRQQVQELASARKLDVQALDDHMPALLDELATALQSKSDQTNPHAVCDESPPIHGLQRLKDGFDIEEVVTEYNILRGCIHDLADENQLNLQGKPFHIINRVFDHAIGLALQTYSTQRALELQRRRAEYLSFVAHDLRTPLNAISLAGRILDMTHPQRDSNNEVAQMLKSLLRNVKHLEVLVRKVTEENANLETEIGIKLERREFDLWPLVEALIHDLHPVAGTASTQLVNKVPDDLVAYADAELLRRVFQNLIANAIKYTPRGTVTIEARQFADGSVECSVCDNGSGIAVELLEKVFDKGETDPEHPGGTGFGLAIVRTFTEAHGGTVAVESKEGVGSTFRFTLPPRAKDNSRS